MKEMEFRTKVDIPKPGFQIEPLEHMLFVGSCFADSIGQRFLEEQFPVTVNPYGVMYNPASILHTVQRFCDSFSHSLNFKFPRIVFLTLGTNHVYRLKETGEIVDNCQKRPASLFQEEQLTVDECTDYLRRTIDLLRSHRPDVHIVLTVSPIRYRKYGYHESQLSKATLLLATNQLQTSKFLDEPSGEAEHKVQSSKFKVQSSNFKLQTSKFSYFPAYEIVLDELRDYRFYKEDMLHPSAQAVEYIWQQLVDHYFSPAAQQYLREWAPLKAALNHRPFNPDSDEYRTFLEQTNAKVDAFLQRWYKDKL